RRRRGAPAVRPRHERRGRRRRRRSARGARAPARPDVRPAPSPGRPRRGEAPLPLAGDPGARRPHGRRLRARARRARLRRRPRPGRCSLRRRRRRGLWDRERLVLGVGSPGMLVAAFTWGDLWRLALAVFLLAVGLATAYLLARLGGTAGRLSAFSSGAERDILPGLNKA